MVWFKFIKPMRNFTLWSFPLEFKACFPLQGGTSSCRLHIFMIYSILLFRLHKCKILLDSYKNKVITSVEFDTMKRTYAELLEISFTEVKVRCAMVMALVYNNGEVDNRTITNTLRVNMRTIQHTHKKLEESKDPCEVITRAPKSLDDCQKSRDADFVKRVEAMIVINPSKSMRYMGAELGVDKRTIQQCVDEDLHYKSYRMQIGQLLTQATKDRKLLNSTKLLNKLKHLKESNMCGSSLMRRISARTRPTTDRTINGLIYAPTMHPE